VNKPKYYYIIVDKENGKPLIESSKLPIFWLKSVAKERLLDFKSGKYVVHRLNISDIETLILKSQKV